MMLHLDLFSGMGGFSFGLERTGGFRTVCFVEKEPHCHKVLNAHWPGVPIVEDVNDVEGIRLHCGAASIITAGVPCQPASVAGSRVGTEDERWLWPQTIAIVGAFRPKWFLAENPTGILSLADGGPLAAILDEVESLGYEVQPITLRACSVGGPHQRARVFFVCRYVANSGHKQYGQQQGSDESKQVFGGPGQRTRSTPAGGDVGDGAGREGHGPERTGRDCPGEQTAWAGGNGLDAWHTGTWARGQDGTLRYVEPEICPVAHGFPGGLVGRVAALKMVGNSVVPQLVEMLGNAILDVEEMYRHAPPPRITVAEPGGIQCRRG